MLDKDDLLRRALAAYFKMGGTDQPAQERSGAEKLKGLHYVVLRNVRGTLAVYRVKADGALRRLRRWPEALDR